MPAKSSSKLTLLQLPVLSLSFLSPQHLSQFHGGMQLVLWKHTPCTPSQQEVPCISIPSSQSPSGEYHILSSSSHEPLPYSLPRALSAPLARLPFLDLTTRRCQGVGW